MSKRRRTARRSRAAVHRRRLTVLVALGVIGYGGLLARAVQLQALDAKSLAARAERQQTRTVHLAPQRGVLLDRHGVLLAGSAQVESVAASPRRIDDRKQTARHLARALELKNRDVRRRISVDKSFVWVRRWVTPEQARRVRELNLSGVDLLPERKRFYPSRELAGAYLGFAGRDGQGLAGVELAFDSDLRGTRASLPARRDAHGRTILDVASAPPQRAGATLVLTLDAQLQHFSEQALARAIERTGAKQAALIALDPRTGDVLAAAQAPGFDPNRFWDAKPSRHRAFSFVDTFEPGSTLKPFSIAIALELGRVTPEDRFDCENGSWRVRDRRIRDWKPYGVLSVREILQYSSNIGAAKIANRVGSKELVAGLRRFGFGESTSSGFPGESSGVVRSIREKQQVERANLAFGHGLTVTALQLAAAGGALANDGVLVRPRLALRLNRGGLTQALPESERVRVLSRKTARTVVGMMRDVVEKGTGGRAALPRHYSAGKTGTAQKVKNGRYSSKHYVASFMGIVPVRDPRLVIVVVLDEPTHGTHTGGAAAAPVFGEVAGFAVELLGVRGDRT